MPEITIIPNEECATPVSDCIQFCLLPDDDVGSGECVNAIVTFTVQGQNQTPDLTFTFAGQQFTTQLLSLPPYSPNSVYWFGTAQEVAANLVGALNSNLLIGPLVNITTQYIPVQDVVEFTVEWLECGEIENFVFDFDNLFLDPFSVFSTNGSSYQLDDPTYQMTYQLVCEDGSRTKTRTVSPSILDGELTEVCLDFSKLLANRMTTPYPTMGGTSGLVESAKKRFSLVVGSQTIDGCDVITGGVIQSNIVNAINSSLQYYDNQGFAPYCFIESNNETKFLTKKPNGYEVCKDQCDWLYYCGDLNTVLFEGIEYAYQISYFQDGNPVPVFIQTQSVSQGVDGVMQIPTGPCNIETLQPTGINYNSYTIQLFAVINGAANPISEVFKYNYDDCCCEDGMEVHFLEPVGGWSSLNFCVVRSGSIQTSGKEICTNTPCKQTSTNIIGGAKSLIERGFEKVNLETDCVTRQEYLNFFREFKLSCDRKIKIKGVDGQFMTVPFVLDTGLTKIYEYGNDIQLKVTGYIGVDLENQCC